MPIIHLKIYEARLNDETEPKLIAGLHPGARRQLRRGHARAHDRHPRRGQAEPVGRRRQGALAIAGPGGKHAHERRRSQRARIARPGRGGRGARVHRLGLHIHRGPAVDEPRRGLAAVLGHAGRHAPALVEGRRRRGGGAPVEQGQRPELGSRGPPADLRALDEQPDPRRARRLAHGAGLALAGQGAQQPQRRRRRLGRLDRLHRSALRPLARLRRRARAGARLLRRLPRRARRRAAAARRRLPEAQRAVLLARREDALDQRHRRRARAPLLGLAPTAR